MNDENGDLCIDYRFIVNNYTILLLTKILYEYIFIRIFHICIDVIVYNIIENMIINIISMNKTKKLF